CFGFFLTRLTILEMTKRKWPSAPSKRIRNRHRFPRYVAARIASVLALLRCNAPAMSPAVMRLFPWLHEPKSRLRVLWDVDFPILASGGTLAVRPSRFC